MQKRVITEENFESYKDSAEDMRMKGRTYKDIAKILLISEDYAMNLIKCDDYRDFRNHYNKLARDKYLRNKMKKEENKTAKEWSEKNSYAFGERVCVAETKPELAEITVVYNGIEIQFKSCSAEYVGNFIKQLV